jgi:hypothetical protein
MTAQLATQPGIYGDFMTDSASREVDLDGYFMPSEGASGGALALFILPSMAAYGQCRQRFDVDPALIAADCIRDESGCVLRYERSFMRPFLGADK